MRLFGTALIVILYGILLAAPSNSAGNSSSKFNVIITRVKWTRTQSSISSTCLEVHFRIVHPDGSLVQFADADGAVIVYPATNSLFVPNYPYMNAVPPIGNPADGYVILRSIDPAKKSVHLIFQVRDPATTALQTGTVQSQFAFTNIPAPIAMNVEHAVNYRYITSLGSVISLNGLTLTNDRFGRTMLRLDLTQTSGRVGDTFIANLSTFVLDSSDQQMGRSSYFGQGSKPFAKMPVCCYLFSPFPTDAQSTFKLNFHLTEVSNKQVERVDWTGFGLDVPLAKLQYTRTDYDASAQGSLKVHNAVFNFESLIISGNNNYLNLVTVKSLDPNLIWRIDNSYWLNRVGSGIYPVGSPENQVFWTNEGDPIGKNESATDFVASAPTSNLLGLTTRAYAHKQRMVTFTDIPIPKQGQTILLSKISNNGLSDQLHLVSIASIPRIEGQTASLWTTPPSGNALQLGLVCTAPFGSFISLSTAGVYDDMNQPIPYDPGVYTSAPARFAPYATRYSQTYYLNIGLPSSKARSINFKAFLSEEVRHGLTVYLSVDSAGTLKEITPGNRPF